MRKYLLFCVIITLFSLISIGFEQQFIESSMMSQYSIWYQPFIILGPYNLLQELINIVVFLFGFTIFFSGGIHRDLYGKGMYEIVRYKTKTRWLNKKIIKTSINLVKLLIFYILISIIISNILIDSSLIIPNIYVFISQFILFYLAIFGIIQIQLFLEIYFIETIANTITLVGSFVMINLYPLVSGNIMLEKILFINNISIIRSNILISSQMDVIILMIIINFMIYILNILAIKKKDIY